MAVCDWCISILAVVVNDWRISILIVLTIRCFLTSSSEAMSFQKGQECISNLRSSAPIHLITFSYFSGALTYKLHRPRNNAPPRRSYQCETCLLETVRETCVAGSVKLQDT